jgi:hypothetical protein
MKQSVTWKTQTEYQTLIIKNNFLISGEDALA